MRYRYEAIDNQRQTVSGFIHAASEREAGRELQQRGLTLFSVESAAQKTAEKQRAGKPSQRETLTVLLELVTLLESGVTLIEAVESLAESSHSGNITAIFAEVAVKLRQGVAFSTVIQQSAFTLPPYIPQLLQAGELTGKLAQTLRQGLEQMEYQAKVQEELRSAMIYPLILIVSGLLAVLIVFTLVVPRFATLLQQKGGELPVLAWVVLSAGQWLNSHLYAVAFTCGVVVLSGFYLFRQPLVRARLWDAAARLPIVGAWLVEAEIGRWAATLGALLENRVAMLTALELAANAVNLPRLKMQFAQIAKTVRSGTHLSQALVDHDAITPTGHNLLQAGERAGKLPAMLKSLAKLYESSSRLRMKRFLLFIEPAAILIIGGIIGLIITAVVLAITSVNQITF